MSDSLADWPIALAALLFAAAYLGAVRDAQARGRRWPRARIAAFLAGIAIVIGATFSPLDALTRVSFTAHMVQHLLLTDAAAPLLLVGAPCGLWYAAASLRGRRRLVRVARSDVVRLVAHPFFALTFFNVVMWGIHLSRFFDLAVVNSSIHVTQEIAFVVAALVFWWPAIPCGLAPRRLPYPARIAYLFVSMPIVALLGFVINQATHPLCAAYAAAGPAAALADQQRAGEVMWIGGSSLMFVAFMLLARTWAEREQRLAAIS